MQCDQLDATLLYDLYIYGSRQGILYKIGIVVLAFVIFFLWQSKGKEVNACD